MFTLDNLFLLLTGLLAAYLCWYFWQRYNLASRKALHNLYYLMGFAVLLISGLLLIFHPSHLGLLESPYVLTVASLIPLGISMGIAEEYFPSWKKAFKWFALIGFLAIAVTSMAGLADLKRIAVPVFHGVAGLVIFLGPFLAKAAPKGFFWVGIGGALIGIGGLALASLSFGAPLFGIFTAALVGVILTPILLLMTGAFTLGFTRKG
ncbi:MAG: hypothetical protein AB1750_05465 [Chloroflexota bacterium]